MKTRLTRRGYTALVGVCALTARGLLGLAYGFDIADQAEPMRWTYILLSTLGFTAWMTYLLESGPLTHPYRKDPPELTPPCAKCARRRAARTHITERGVLALLCGITYPSAALGSALAELEWRAVPTTMALIATVAMTAAVLSTIGVICEKGPLTKRLHPDENTEH